MKIEERKYVAIEYRLSLDSGEVADQSEPDEPLGFLFGSSHVIPGLQKALAGMEAGQSARVTVVPEEGYGQPDPNLIREIPLTNFPEGLDLQPGMGFEAAGPHGTVLFRVQEVKGDAVTADFNHPLAGETLHFDVRVAEVREPTEEELGELSADCDCGEDHEGCASDCGTCGCGC
jgi:FKBP-type peptidyl-prolyl cis-trans isomerase SlyD